MTIGALSSDTLKPALIDFYILSQGIPPQFHHPQALQQHRLDVINAWKRTLLRDIEFCCACEFRHIDDSTASPKGSPNWKVWFLKQFGEVGGLWFDKWTALKHNPPMPISKDEQFTEDVQYVLTNNKNNNKGRKNSYAAAKNAELQHGLSLIEVSERAFNPDLANWGGAFGGKSWQRIAQTLLHLWHASDLNEIVHLIDTAFALHHNTNIVFNKNMIWAGSDGYNWIQHYLDYKWAAFSPISILGMASPHLQAMARDSMFAIGTDLSPKTLEKKHLFHPDSGKAVSVTLQEGNTKSAAQVLLVEGSFFKSVVLQGSKYKVQKTFGKHSKTINLRIYLMEEFLQRLQSVEEVLPMGHKAKGALSKAIAGLAAAGNPFTSKNYIVFQHYRTLLQSAYEKFAEGVTAAGLVMGNFLEANTTVRFRVKGGTQPLRFYFSVEDEKLQALVGHTEQEDPTQAALMCEGTKETFSVDSILAVLNTQLKMVLPNVTVPKVETPEPEKQT